MKSIDLTADIHVALCVGRALHRFLECAYGLTSQHCGDKGRSASEFLRTYTEKAVGSLITSTCRKFPAGAKEPNYPGKVVEVDVADNLREVNVQEDETTVRSLTSTRPPRVSRPRGPKKEGRRSKSTAPGNTATTPMSRGPDSARSQQTSGPNGAASPGLYRQSFWSVGLAVFFLIITLLSG